MLRLVLACLLVLPVAAFADEQVHLKAMLEEVTDSSAISDSELVPVYGVIGAQQIPFRNQPNLEERVLGYFPPAKAVWVVRVEGAWALARFRGVSAWVLKEDLVALFTVDDPRKESE